MFLFFNLGFRSPMAILSLFYKSIWYDSICDRCETYTRCRSHCSKRRRTIYCNWRVIRSRICSGRGNRLQPGNPLRCKTTCGWPTVMVSTRLKTRVIRDHRCFFRHRAWSDYFFPFCFSFSSIFHFLLLFFLGFAAAPPANNNFVTDNSFSSVFGNQEQQSCKCSQSWR